MSKVITIENLKLICNEIFVRRLFDCFEYISEEVTFNSVVALML